MKKDCYVGPINHINSGSKNYYKLYIPIYDMAGLSYVKKWVWDSRRVL